MTAQRSVLIGLGVALVSGCATTPPASCLITRKPVLRKVPVAWHLIDVTVLEPLKHAGLVGDAWRHVVRPPPSSAMAVFEPSGESSFWTARDPAQWLASQVRIGPTKPEQRAQAPFLVIRVKDEGKTPGFVVTDSKGDRYLFKLDLAASPELLTGAEVVSSKLLHALGYAVPSYEIVDVAVDDLSADPAHDVSRHQLDELLAGHVRNGRLRVSASRWLDGEILGPFSFKRYRHCPELRALKLAYAWVNNTDAKDRNTLMVWTDERAMGYLIDFGSSLGANASRGPKAPCQGWVYDVDLGEGALELLTLGLHESGCDPQQAQALSPAVGAFSPQVDPRRWKPYAPNPAFDAMTEADARWMASLLARFSRAQVAAAVAAGQYQNPADAQRIADVLDARREAIVRVYQLDSSGR